MAQIILTDYKRIEIKEDKKQLLELITDDKQFIIINLKYTIDISKSKYEYDVRIEYEQTAINKAHIIQAF